MPLPEQPAVSVTCGDGTNYGPVSGATGNIGKLYSKCSDEITDMYVPPNQVATIFVDWNDGNGSGDNGRFGAGNHNQDGAKSLNYAALGNAMTDTNYMRYLMDQADVVQVEQLWPWPEHMNKCCFGETVNGVSFRDRELCGTLTNTDVSGKTMPDTCGEVAINACGSGARKGELCDQEMQKLCSADDIKSVGQGNGNNKNKMCNSWCAKNPGACDKIKTDFCKANPNSPFCDCINANSRSEYISYARKYPNALDYSKVCTSQRCAADGGVDLRDIFYTAATVKEQANQNCVDIRQKIQAYTPTTQGTYVEPPPDMMGQRQYIQGVDNMVIYFVFLVCVAAVGYFVFYKDNLDKTGDQANAVGQPMGQPNGQPMYGV